MQTPLGHQRAQSVEATESDAITCVADALDVVEAQIILIRDLAL
jgi:hypothetical protein